MKKRDRTLWFLGGAVVTLLALLAGIPFAASALVPEAAASATPQITRTPRAIPTIAVPEWLIVPSPRAFPSVVPTFQRPDLSKPPVSVTPRPPRPTATPGPCDSPLAESSQWHAVSLMEGTLTIDIPADWALRDHPIRVVILNKSPGCIPTSGSPARSQGNFYLAIDRSPRRDATLSTLVANVAVTALVQQHVEFTQINGLDVALVTLVSTDPYFLEGGTGTYYFAHVLKGDSAYTVSTQFVDTDFVATFQRLIRSVK